jgi:hypothetical protein
MSQKEIENVPNGFDGTPEKWVQIQALFREIDDTLNDFACAHGLNVSSNYHNWPERSLVWYEDDIRKLIQIYLADQQLLTFNVWLCASVDKEHQRYWKNVMLKKGVPFVEIKDPLLHLLSEGLQTVQAWQASDLEPTGT